MAPLAPPVGLAIDLAQGVIDLLDGGRGLCRQGQVPLTVDGDRAALARLLVELDIAGLALEGQRVGLGPEVDGLAAVDAPLLEQQGPLLVEELGVLGVGTDRGPLRGLRGRASWPVTAFFFAGAVAWCRRLGRGCRLLRRCVFFGAGAFFLSAADPARAGALFLAAAAFLVALAGALVAAAACFAGGRSSCACPPWLSSPPWPALASVPSSPPNRSWSQGRPSWATMLPPSSLPSHRPPSRFAPSRDRGHRTRWPGPSPHQVGG